MAKVQHAAQTGADLHEPKGVASASENDTLVADGLGSADWENPVSYAEIAIDLGSTLTRSFVGATPFTDFILDYNAEHEVQFTYNDTTKELLYTGARDIIIQFVMTMSIARTDVSGTPEMTIALFEDVGAGFVEITSSIVARSFPSTDVGSMTMSGLHTITNGDKLKLQVQTDGSIDIEIRNMNWSVHSVGLV